MFEYGRHQTAAQKEDKMKLKLVSIFHTLDGECTLDGPLQWSTFIRTAGCNLRCWKSSGFCDAPHSLDFNHPWPEWELEDIVKEVQKYSPCKRVTISGGEPLWWEATVCELSSLLRKLGYKTNLETSGSLDISLATAYFDCVIMDVKPPATEMSKKNLPENMGMLRHTDYCKFVIQDRNDYDWSIFWLNRYPTVAKVAFGPRHGYLEPAELIQWLRDDKRFDIRLNIQTHKYIWPGTEAPPVKSLSEVDYEAVVKKEC